MEPPRLQLAEAYGGMGVYINRIFPFFLLPITSPRIAYGDTTAS